MFASAMNAPNFFILGAARCGTTSLYRYLQRHPDVFMATPKEPKFFEAEWSKGPEYYWRRYFADWNGEPCAGEARPANLFLPFVPERISRLAPDARLIVMLRDPVHRAYSSWRLRRLNGLEPAGFAEVVRDNLASLESGRTFAGEAGERLWRERAKRIGNLQGLRVDVDLGYYAEQLARYLELFPPQRIKVIWFEDLCRDAAAVAREAWWFLGVDPARGVRESTTHNASLSHTLGPLVRFARAARINSLLSPRATARLRRISARLVPDKPIDPSVERCLRAHYEPHILALEALVDRDLGHWR